jgi:hypothetical protein
MPEFIEIATGEPIEVPCGPLCFRLRRREVGDDGGLSIELYGTRGGEESELLRFDLFRNDPHYHVPASTGKPTGRIDPERDALAWTLGRIEHDLPSLLREADAAEHASAIEGLVMAPIIGRLTEAAERAPDPSERRRVELTPHVRELIGL